MKIFFVIESLKKGGAERVVSTFSKAADSEGHEAYIITFLPQVSYSHGGKLICLNIPYGKGKLGVLMTHLYRTYELRKLIKKHSPDKIISFMEAANIVSILAKGKSYIDVSIRQDVDHYGKLMITLMKFIYPRARHVLVNSKIQISKLKKKIPRANLFFLPNPIELGNKCNSLIAMPSVHKRSFILGVGRLVKEKRFDILIESYALSNLEIDYDLIILGEGEKREQLEKQIKAFNLSRVFLLGEVEDPRVYMRACDLFVMSSDTEGCPNALLEAMASAALVITTRCQGGESEIVVDNQNGFVTECGNSVTLAEVMKKTLSLNPLKKEELQCQAKLSMNQYDDRVILTKLLEIV